MLMQRFSYKNAQRINYALIEVLAAGAAVVHHLTQAAKTYIHPRVDLTALAIMALAKDARPSMFPVNLIVLSKNVNVLWYNQESIDQRGILNANCQCFQEIGN